MNDNQTQALTYGHLPVAAFGHPEPTAIGIVDLDRSITPNTPGAGAWQAGQRDSLLLVRLHGEPLAVVHVDAAPQRITADRLAAEIWQSAGEEIREHIERLDCTSIPQESGALIDGLPLRGSSCARNTPAKVDVSVAVIVPTVGRGEQLERCLVSLLAQRTAKFELIVVDNRPATGTTLPIVSELAASDSRVHYVAEPRLGSSVARNRGVAATDADIVAFTDDDVVVDPSWLEWLLTPFADPAVTVTTGMVLPLELNSAAQKRFELYGGFSKGVERRAYDMQNNSALLYPFMGDIFGSGNSMAFRRIDLVAAGGFDPALGGGSPARSGEDLYAFSTAILSGGRLIYEPRSVCWHEHRKSDEALDRQVFDYGVGLGAMMTKASLSGDARFFRTLARSTPTAIGLLRQRLLPSRELEADGNAPSVGMTRAQYMGMLLGPWRYCRGVIRKRRLGLADAIREA